MQHVDVTPRAWERLLAVHRGLACHCCGQWSEGERAALDLYGPLARRDLGPLAVAQIGQSLDGRVATVNGDARDVSGPDGLMHLHRIRALVDAVVIGVGTALHDRPRLTVRLCPGENPARVIIDPRGRLPDDAPALADDGATRIVVQACGRTRPAGVKVLRLAWRGEQLDPTEITETLCAEGLQSLLIEGGGITIARFLEAQRLTRLQVAIAPLLIGSGPQGLNLPSRIRALSDAIRPEMRVFSLGSDVVFDCALNEQGTAGHREIHSRQASG